MKALRTLLLGSAGAALLFTAGTVAQASDAPMAVKGREPVWRCDTAGFIEYPGSDMCFKIGGTVTVWIAHHEDQNDGDNEFNTEDTFTPDGHTLNDTTWMSGWARPYIDVRQATEYGVVRAYIEFQVGEGGSINARHVFIQVGNWLWGYTTSTVHQGYGRPELFSEDFGVPGDPEAVPRVHQIRYTFTAGDGVEINLAIQDPATNDGSYDTIVAASRNEIPDGAANIKVKTSWGGFGIGVGVHQHSATGFGGADTNRRPVGWGVLAGTDINVGPNDTLMVQGSYCDGWTGACDNKAAFEIGQIGPGGTATTKTKSWGVIGGWEHDWGNGVRSTVAGSYVDNDYDGADTGLVGGSTAFYHAKAIDTVTSVWANVVKELSPGLEIGVEVLWGKVDTLDGLDNDAFGFAGQMVRKFPR